MLKSKPAYFQDYLFIGKLFFSLVALATSCLAEKEELGLVLLLGVALHVTCYELRFT